MDGPGTTWRRNIAENFNRLSRVHQRYRRQTDRRQTDGPSMTYSEHELEFTFAKNGKLFFTQNRPRRNPLQVHEQFVDKASVIRYSTQVFSMRLINIQLSLPHN